MSTVRFHCSAPRGIGIALTAAEQKGEVMAEVCELVGLLDAPVHAGSAGLAASFGSLVGAQGLSSPALTGFHDMTAHRPMAPSTAKILIVDDQPEVGAVLEDYFSGRGFEVIRAGGGLEALAKIEKDPPAMVLLDVRMPDLDGVEVLRKIREAGPTPPGL